MTNVVDFSTRKKQREKEKRELESYDSPTFSFKYDFEEEAYELAGIIYDELYIEYDIDCSDDQFYLGANFLREALNGLFYTKNDLHHMTHDMIDVVYKYHIMDMDENAPEQLQFDF